MKYLKQSTVATIKLGPFVDSGDAVTPETALTLAVKVSKNGGTKAARSSATAIVHDSDGDYTVELDATDTGAVGRLRVSATATGALPAWDDFSVLSAAVYDVLFGTVAPSTHTAAAVQALVAAGTVATVTTLTNLPAAPTDWLSAAAVSAAAAVKIEDAVWAGAPASTPLTDIAAAVWDAAPASTPLADVAAAVVAHADFIALDDKADAILVDTGTDIPATLTVIDDFLDTEMAAVKAKTDLIPDLAATGTVTGSGGTTTTLVGDSGLSASDDFYNGAVLAFTSGALKGTGGRRITDYAGTTKTFTFASAWPSAPANGATFVVLGRIDPAS